MSVAPLLRPAAPAGSQPAAQGSTPPAAESPARAALFPSLRALADWREPYLVPLVILVLTRVVLARLLPLASEDAYITYRYARNLALGYGAVFNPGQRVMGFSSPLWMAWNALGWKLMHDPATWSRVSTLCGDAVTLLIGASLLARHVSRASAWCFAFAFAAWTAFTGVAISGMENSMMVTLVLLAGALTERDSRATGPTLAALALIRPEGIVAAAVIGLRARWRDRLVALAIVGAGVSILTLYFGSPLPQSMTTKALIYGTPGPWAGRHWWEWTSPFALGRWPVMPDCRFLFLITVLAAPAAVVGLGVAWRIRGSGLACAIAACLAVWLGYSVLGVAYFFWYLVVPLAGWFLLAAMGLPRIVRGPALYGSAALLILGCWTVIWELYAARARAEEGFGRVADYLALHASPWQKVMLEPIGLVGYRAKLVVVDEIGLVSPEVAQRRLRGAGWLTDVVAAERPEWLVARRSELEHLEAFAGMGAPFRDPAERDALLQRYAVATVIDSSSEDAALLVLRRRS